MKTSVEERLRTHFTETASRFSMTGGLPPEVPRRARRRLVGAVAAGVIAALVLGSLSVVILQAGHTAPVAKASHETIVRLRLVDYAEDSDGSGLRAYSQCMRAQGYDTPDPVPTADGWALLVPPGSIDRTSTQWREAAFVTCNLHRFVPRPLSGDLILGFSDEKIDAFIACMGGQGYDLAKPSPDAEGNYRWDLEQLRGQGIDTTSDGWYRATLVTCSPTGD